MRTGGRWGGKSQSIFPRAESSCNLSPANNGPRGRKSFWFTASPTKRAGSCWKEFLYRRLGERVHAGVGGGGWGLGVVKWIQCRRTAPKCVKRSIYGFNTKLIFVRRREEGVLLRFSLRIGRKSFISMTMYFK